MDAKNIIITMVFDHFKNNLYEKTFSEKGAKTIVIVMLFARFLTKKQNKYVFNEKHNFEIVQKALKTNA